MKWTQRKMYIPLQQTTAMMPEIMINTKNLQVIPPHNKGSPATLQTMKGHHKTAEIALFTIYQTIQLMQ